MQDLAVRQEKHRGSKQASESASLFDASHCTALLAIAARDAPFRRLQRALLQHPRVSCSRMEQASAYLPDLLVALDLHRAAGTSAENELPNRSDVPLT